MNAKKILSLILALVIALPVTAYAQGNGKSEGKQNNTVQSVQNSKEQGLCKFIGDYNDEDTNADKDNGKGASQKQAALQNRDEKHQQIAAFKTQMTEKHVQMKALTQQAKTLRQQADQKRKQLSAIIVDILSGRKTLSDDLLQQLLTAVQDLNKGVEAVKPTAEITGSVTDTQNQINTGKFNNALTSMDEVIAKLQARVDALTKLNAALDKVLEIASQAVAPAPAPGTDPTPVPDQGTTDSQTTETTQQTPSTSL